MTQQELTAHSLGQSLNDLANLDIVYMMTYFVLRPYKKAEMDGIVSSALLCGALSLKETCRTWFEKVEALHYFDEH